MEEREERILAIAEQLVDCVQNLVAANREMFHMVAMITGIEGGAYKEANSEEAPKLDLTGKPIR